MVRRILPKLILSLLLGGLFAFLVAREGVPLLPTQAALANVQWWTVAAYALVLVATHFFRASRWRFLIEPYKRIPLRDVVLLNWIGFFAIFAFPLRLGEFARPALTKARHQVPVSVGMGTVAVERVVDGLITSLCVAWALFALPRQVTDDPEVLALPYYGYLALAVFCSAFVALGLFLWQRALATALVERAVGLVSPRLGAMVASKVAGVAEGIQSVGDARLGAGFLLETLIYWGLNAFGMWLLAWGCGIPMTLAHGVAVMGILAIGILLPAGPGLFGNFHFAVSLALKLYFATSLVTVQGSAYIFLMYSVQAVLITLLGVVPLYALQIPFSALLRLPNEPQATGQPQP